MVEFEPAMWVGILDGKVVAKKRRYEDLIEVLEKKYPDKAPVISTTIPCETLIL